MSRFGRIPTRIPIKIPADEQGMTGRECPNKDCLGYFKVQIGTGLQGRNLPCHCPYCGDKAPHDHFWTPEQLKYAQSVGMRKASDILTRELKKLEFKTPARGPLGVEISMKLKEGRRPQIRHYREKELETEVICSSCTLRYSIYGVFAYCPDCGMRNSLQILEKNLDLAEKEISLAGEADASDLREYLVGDALENVVSAFDGFGRETCRLHSPKASEPERAKNLSFQNIRRADENGQKLFGIHLSSAVSPGEWDFADRCFKKRHLLAHSMGVVDDKYVDETQDPDAVVGRKVQIAT